MDFSHLHTYAPPQCMPENTGYTYALSSSYSTAALDFETKNKLNPVYDSPRMSRRSLRLVTSTGYFGADEVQNDSINSNNSFTGSISSSRSSKTSKQNWSMSKQSSVAVNRTPRKSASNTSLLAHSSFNSHISDTSVVSTLLDETLIREQTEVDHFWGLDDDGDLRGAEPTYIQANGALSTAETQTTLINGYTCNDCSMLSERTDVLTAYSTQNAKDMHSAYSSQKAKDVHTTYSTQNAKDAHTAYSTQTASSTVYSRDRSKHKSRNGNFTSKILQIFKKTATSFASLFIQLFQMVSLKRGSESKAHSNYCGSMNVNEFLKEDGHLHVNGDSLWKAASSAFWWLGTGWYQLVTWISLFNVFLLTRCLPKAFKLFLLLLPLLLLLGLWCWGLEGILSTFPFFFGTSMRTAHKSDESSIPSHQPDISGTIPPPKVVLQFGDRRVAELEEQIALLSGKYHHHIEEYNKMVLNFQKLQQQISHMDDKSGMSAMITNIMSQHFQTKNDQASHSMDEFQIYHKDHAERIFKLEELLAKLPIKSEELQKELETAKMSRSASGFGEHDEHLMKKVHHLEQELMNIKTELLNWQSFKRSCEKMDTIHEQVDAQVKESVKVMFFGNTEEDLPESLLQWLSSKCVDKSDFQVVLQGLEMRILRNITQYVANTQKMPNMEVVQSAVTGGISGITAEQAHIIVDNALKLYSQDKMGMVDYALESGGGSILGTRCSETYETKTALMSLFGVPLWYFSQSPRVVIQPDMYPGNCWAFKGSQGYLVVRLSMKIYPTSFTVEHIPKTLSPTGNITSAPKDFAVYGLDDEYQEEGKLLGQYVYNQEGDSLQTFQVTEEIENAFQIVELRILSNWGHTEYTCLYRFRVHGNSATTSSATPLNASASTIH